MKKSSIDELHSAVNQLWRAKEQARALGMFTDDRELLACPVCGLLEDVTVEGMLITYFKDSPQQEDSGLRFKEIDGTCFKCPACGASIAGEE